ncbi:hypothetical protein BC939DRAFT_439010 [Gamsiella multidivaricata]|uniref:uncharacterized protein n=1 Tax=Gamsiella multidivaricata TaxID=101098 RepID=UPI00221FB0EF|nr:uncharacterized protein BC939DRAFT_439010 [Gamsiella multidivaricata]KAG0369640.1 hypothetical protein BGZ54_009372 [Gamsiella multidivaricata]KAI7830764.1 hypothetical protein BC939DRAFT_439010 [Gamsiella multidivaricata]
MKSKARNSKGSKKSANGSANGAKESSVKDGLVTHIISPLDQGHPGAVNTSKAGSGTNMDKPSASEHNTTLEKFGPRDMHHSTALNGIEYTRADRKVMPTTSMETEFIEALYSDFAGQSPHSQGADSNHHQDTLYDEDPDLEDLPPNFSESEGNENENVDSYEDQAGDSGCENFGDDLDVYEHDDFLSSQEAILMELRREQVEFEENVRQLQQQLQRQGSLLPISTSQGTDYNSIARDVIYSDAVEPLDTSMINCDSNSTLNALDDDQEHDTLHSTLMHASAQLSCKFCPDPKSVLCLEKYGWAWKPVIVEAMATAAAAIANFSTMQHRRGGHGDYSLRYSEFLPKPKRHIARPRGSLQHDPNLATQPDNTSYGETQLFNSAVAVAGMSGHIPAPTAPIRHMYRGSTPPPPAVLYPLPPNSPYKFSRKSSEFLEPVGEFHEFQSAEGNSRQVLLHVWPPSSLDTPLLQKLETCCRDFQEHDIVRGHSGDGFLNGWRPSWRQSHQTGVLRFGHWRVRAPAGQGTRLYPPFQTPLTLAAGGGTVLGSNLDVNLPANNNCSYPRSVTPVANMDGTSSSHSPNTSQTHHHHYHHHHHHHHHQHQGHQTCTVHDAPAYHTDYQVHEQKAGQDVVPGSVPNLHSHGSTCNTVSGEKHGEHYSPAPQDLHVESSTRGRLLRLIRAIQMVEKVIIARHLKYLFPTLYEKYHGLQFGTPRLFDAVATVALAMDVSPRLHHDKTHTKHGFCWIVACGDFIGGDLCIPELGKRVVMRPGTVVAIRSTVVAYYIERYAKDTSMYTMYAYTSDNNWPPAA